MAPLVIIYLIIIIAFIVGILYALFVNADIIPELFITGLIVFLVMLIALPFIRMAA